MLHRLLLKRLFLSRYLELSTHLETMVRIAGAVLTGSRPVPNLPAKPQSPASHHAPPKFFLPAKPPNPSSQPKTPVPLQPTLAPNGKLTPNPPGSKSSSHTKNILYLHSLHWACDRRLHDRMTFTYGCIDQLHFFRARIWLVEPENICVLRYIIHQSKQLCPRHRLHDAKHWDIRIRLSRMRNPALNRPVCRNLPLHGWSYHYQTSRDLNNKSRHIVQVTRWSSAAGTNKHHSRSETGDRARKSCQPTYSGSESDREKLKDQVGIDWVDHQGYDTWACPLLWERNRWPAWH